MPLAACMYLYMPLYALCMIYTVSRLWLYILFCCRRCHMLFCCSAGYVCVCAWYLYTCLYRLCRRYVESMYMYTIHIPICCACYVEIWSLPEVRVCVQRLCIWNVCIRIPCITDVSETVCVCYTCVYAWLKVYIAWSTVCLCRLSHTRRATRAVHGKEVFLAKHALPDMFFARCVYVYMCMYGICMYVCV